MRLTSGVFHKIGILTQSYSIVSVVKLADGGSPRDVGPVAAVKCSLYIILLPINSYGGNSTTKCHSGSMSDNRDLTELFHQKFSSHYKVIASAF